MKGLRGLLSADNDRQTNRDNIKKGNHNCTAALPGDVNLVLRARGEKIKITVWSASKEKQHHDITFGTEREALKCFDPKVMCSKLWIER